MDAQVFAEGAKSQALNITTNQVNYITNEVDYIINEVKSIIFSVIISIIYVYALKLLAGKIVEK